MKTTATILGLALMTACSGKQETPIEIQTDEYMVVDFNPPKHVHVDIVRISDGRTFRVSLGKHCNGWRELANIGRKVKLNRYVYTDGTDDRIVFDREEVKDCFCN